MATTRRQIVNDPNIQGRDKYKLRNEVDEKFNRKHLNQNRMRVTCGLCGRSTFRTAGKAIEWAQRHRARFHPEIDEEAIKTNRRKMLRKGKQDARKR